MDVPAIVEQLDMRYLIDTLVDIAQVPTDVPLGPNVFMAPDDPKLRVDPINKIEETFNLRR